MRDDRKEIVAQWFFRAQRFWILSRVGDHEFHFDSCAWHIHALALEVIIKAAILTKEPRAATWAGFNSRDIFRDGHNVIRLLLKWNALAPEHAITPKSHPLLHTAYSSDKKEFVPTPDSFGSLGMYLKTEMVGRYSEGVLMWSAHAIDAANLVFFRLREYLREFLDIDEDAIDRAMVGNAGRAKGAEWLSRAVRKSNAGLPLESRMHD